MRWLPAFDFQGREMRFPLCAGTARLLLRAIHADSMDEIASPLATGLLVDPFATMWLCQQVHGVQPHRSLQQLVRLGEPTKLRSYLAKALIDSGPSPTRSILQRAQRSALGAAIRIARSESTLRGALESPRVVDILRQVALAANCEPLEPQQSMYACDAISAKAGDAEALAILEETSVVGSQLARRLHRAWQAPAADPWQILRGSLVQWRRLEALELHFAETLTAAKLAALKELAYGASHEINNPIANISARAQVLLKDESLPQRRRALTIIHQQALRAHQMIADLMLFAKPPALRPERIRVAELIADLVRFVQREASARGSELMIRQRMTPTLGWVDADREQLELALQAICQNATEAMGDRGTLTIFAAGGIGRSGNAELRIRVRDTGPGIAASIMPHLFDPFFSGREAGRGLGFGLSRAWRVVSDHGGTIVVDSTPGEGATFTICLPGYLPRQNGCVAA